MDFNALSSISGKSSMRRKQSNSLLQSFGKSSSSSSSRQSAIPLPSSSNSNSNFNHNSSNNNNIGGGSGSNSLPNSRDNTPLTSTTSQFNYDELYSPSPENSSSSYSHSNYHSNPSGGGGGIDTISLSSKNTYYQNSYGLGINSNSNSNASTHGHGGHGGRSTSANYNLRDKHNNNRDLNSEKEKERSLKRPEDVSKLVRERIMSWSYLNEWYQGDTHWLNTIKISRSTLENAIGPKQLENRARNFYILGISLSSLFDIPSSSEFLKALLKLFDEWEGFSDNGGGKGVKNLFRGQRSNRKVTAGGTVMSDFATGMDGTESYLLNVNMPFIPDFYQTHSTLCSIIRDIYKKLLGMFLPSPPSSSSISIPSISNSSLLHSSTIIQSAPLEIPFGIGNIIPTPKSPAASIITATFSNQQHSQHGHSHGYGNSNQVTSPISEGGHGGGSSYFGGTAQPQNQPRQSFNGQQQQQGDALQLYIAGELPSDRTLVGDGQKLTPQIVELFGKVDTKLKKQFSILIREGDTLARKVLDEELSSILNSLNPGSKSLNFDFNAALIGSGNGWINSINPNSNNNNNTGMMGTISGYNGLQGLQGLMEEERRERDFGTI